MRGFITVKARMHWFNSKQRQGSGVCFSFFVQPALIYNQHSGWTLTSTSFAYGDSTTYAEDGGSINLQLHKGYVKLNIFNFEVEVGRDSLWWGPVITPALLMSNNAPPWT